MRVLTCLKAELKFALCDVDCFVRVRNFALARKPIVTLNFHNYIPNSCKMNTNSNEKVAISMNATVTGE